MKQICLLILFIFCFNTSVLAETIHSSQFQYANSNRYLLLYSEDNKFIVSAYQEVQNNLQKRIFNKSFANSTLALNKYKEIYKTYTQWSQQEPPLGDAAGPNNDSSSHSNAPHSSLWKVTQQWSTAWENKYSEWIIKNVDENFFYNNNIATDCADVVVSLRWIFARENGLPVANSLAGSGKLMTQDSWSADWQKLPTSPDWKQDQRFKAVINDLLENVYTETLLADSYPIQISKNSIIPGVHHLEFPIHGHAMLVYTVNPGRSGFFGTDPEFVLLQSTTPRAVRVLSSTDYYRTTSPQLNREGFMRMRWPLFVNGKWVLNAPENHPTYSKEQYDPTFAYDYGFSAAVKQRLFNKFDAITEYQNTLAQLRNLTALRDQKVNEGFFYCQQNSCAPGTDAWEEYATTNRDARLRDLMIQSEKIGNRHPQTQKLWNQFIQESIQIGEEFYNINDIINHFVRTQTNPQMAADPRNSVALRWGF